MMITCSGAFSSAGHCGSMTILCHVWLVSLSQSPPLPSPQVFRLSSCFGLQVQTCEVFLGRRYQRALDFPSITSEAIISFHVFVRLVSRRTNNEHSQSPGNLPFPFLPVSIVAGRWAHESCFVCIRLLLGPQHPSHKIGNCFFKTLDS